jgi:hypothetical protein
MNAVGFAGEGPSNVVKASPVRESTAVSAGAARTK